MTNTKKPQPLSAEQVKSFPLSTFAGLIMALAGSIVFVLCRFDFEMPWQALAKIWLLSLAVLFLPEWICRVASRKGNYDSSLWVVGILGALTLAGFSGVMPEPLWLLAFIGLVLLFARSLLLTLPQLDRKTWAMLGAMLLFAFWLQGTVYNYLNPLFDYRLQAGISNIDTLFHIAYSNIIRSFGIASTGVDGVPLITSHFGSHWLFAQWARLLDINMTDWYLIAYPIFILPLMIKTMLDFASATRQSLGKAGSSSHNWGFWAVLFISFIGLVYHEVALKMAAYWNTHIYSPSYSVALILSFLSGSVAISLYRVMQANPATARDRMLLALMLITFPVLVGMAIFSKISFVVLLVPAYAYLLLRTGLWRQPALATCFIFTSALSYVIYKLTSLPMPVTIRPFDFFLEYVHPLVLLPGYFFLNYLGLIALLFFMTRLLGIQTGAAFKEAFLQKKFLMVELVLVVAIIGLIPGNVLALAGGAGQCFSNFQYWLAMCFLMALSPEWTPLFSTTYTPRNLWKTPGFGRKLAVIIALVFLGNFIANVLYGSFRVYRSNQKTRAFLAKTHVAGSRALFARLNELQQLPVSVKRTTLVYIPRDISAYWQLLPCKTIPFLVPAYTGMAMIQGLPQAGCATHQSHGYGHYDLLKKTKAFPAESLPLCTRARAFGFNQIVALQQTSGNLELRSMTCPADPVAEK